MTIREWQKKIHEWALSKGWTDDTNVGEDLALVHSEISEALEEYRDGHPLTEIRVRDSDGKPEGFGVEMADAVIRILHECAKRGIDLEALVEIKMAYNEKRPYRHGGKIA